MPTHKVPHILKLSRELQKDFIDSFDVVMCDCDGVMWMVASPLPRTGEAVNLLRSHGKEVIFVSNNSMHTDEEYVEKFKRIGVKDFVKNDIMHPVKSMLFYIKKHEIAQPVFSLCSVAANQMLRDAGIDVRTLVTNENVTTVNLEQVTRPEERMGAVLFDINLDLTYAQIVAATRYLADKDCKFIAGGTDWLLPITEDLTVPGFCDYLDTLKRFTGREPIIVSKPALLLGEILEEVHELLDHKRCLFIGDSLTHDVRFGLNCGFQTLLVLSGSTPIGQMWKESPENLPLYYADSIADLIELYANVRKNA